jgi:hypothetical protein
MTRRTTPELGTTIEPGTMSVYDGSRRIGALVPRAGKLECFDVEGVYICSVAERDRKAGMRAVAEADKKRREIAGAAA